MEIDLYPAEHETDNATEELLNLLSQSGCTCDVRDAGHIAKKIIVHGDLTEICLRVRDWLDQNPGRTATPASFCDTSLQREGPPTTTIQIHRSSVGFAKP